ncbi:tetratricopeptide repeat protein [Candidatus Venteria ishoeyi]|uniref:histidine kinase n=1 Tax=Candidatus Venteria ishoeyi TaxID=1899563 RepID=A0A1H6F6A7_9GAMM|nr:tetratricopeptide repeat protein [Candidatus Venteria ishoeyi]SEH04534.1 C4-dicarboxylate transport sensor protein DctB [Candidatus Venteria ishoeyi]
MSKSSHNKLKTQKNLKKILRLAEESFKAGKKYADNERHQAAADKFLAAAKYLYSLKDLNTPNSEIQQANALAHASLAFNELHQYKKAKSLAKKALAIQEKILGTEHHEIALSLNDLATILIALGEYDNAKYFLKRAIKIQEKQLPYGHSYLANSLNNLAGIYIKLNNYNKAKTLAERALRIQKEYAGLDNPDSASHLDSLANIYANLDTHDKAMELYQQALEIRKKHFGELHPLVASSLNKIATVYASLKRYDEAKSLHKKALEIQEKKLPSDHLDISTTLNNLANISSNIAEEEYDRARKLYEESLIIRKKHLGLEHPDIASILNNLAIVYSAQGQDDKAQVFFQKAQEIFRKSFKDTEHPFTKAAEDNTLKLQHKIKQLERINQAQRIELEETKKLSYLGQMATGVAHNINNPVGIIRMAAQRGLRRLNKPEGLTPQENREIFETVLNQADRLHSIIENFRNFANGDRSQREIIDLNRLVERVKDYFSGQFQSHDVSLELNLASSKPQAYANNFVLEEVLSNLLTNAREAVQGQNNATVWVKTWADEKNSGFEVKDNGPGVNDEQVEHLFSPFHSEKTQGTGLGLYFTQQALAEINAKIDYQKSTGGGAHFIVTLPIARKEHNNG